MSMISSLIDKLNKSADEWNGSNMFELARMCREAADTIWELRDDLQRANDETAKLRELVEYMHRCFVRGHDWGPYCEGETVWVEQRMRELGIEVDG